MRKCKGCNWEYPDRYNRTSCKFCKCKFDEKYCVGCDKVLSLKDFYMDGNKYRSQCRKCNADRLRQYDKQNPERVKARKIRNRMEKLEQLDILHQSWLDKVKVPFKPLSEDEWHKACQYFGGCALCGNEHIEAREFFLPFGKGGKYAAWNMFPLCGKCATISRRVENPFRWLDNREGYLATIGISTERRQKLIDYFYQQIEKVGNQDGQG